ncbi:MAG: ABC transporter permease [Candidatus Methanofastidiosia archaeon]
MAIDVTKDETEIVVKRRRMGQMMTVLRRLKRNRMAILGSAIVLVVVFTAIFAPQLSPYNPKEIVLFERYDPPSSKHLLGTDELGRDVLSRLIWGARISMVVGIVAVLIASTTGTFLGCISAYSGGKVDDIIQRFVDIFLSLPFLFVILLALQIYPQGGIWMIAFVIGIFSWTGYCRIVRSQILSLKESDYAEAARALGANDLRIIFRHLLPNAMNSILVVATFGIAGAILTEAGISFLGFGDPTQPSWGQMLTRGRDALRYAWWAATFPGLAIFFTVLGFNFFGDGLRDALDPRLKQ